VAAVVKDGRLGEVATGSVRFAQTAGSRTIDVAFATDLSDLETPYAELSFCLDGQWHQQRVELSMTSPP
jgi:hypothetical protein